MRLQIDNELAVQYCKEASQVSRQAQAEGNTDHGSTSLSSHDGLKGASQHHV